jgi:dUTP pyrophosphatase
MDISHLKRSMQEIGRTVGAIVEEKLGERSQLEEQVRGIAKQVEKVVGEALWNRPAEKVTIKFKRLDHFKGDLPAYATSGASGMDVRACLIAEVVLQPGERCLIPTGLSVEIPRGFEIQVRPRSGLAIKKGLGLVNTPGTIDADYRGEIKLILINLGQDPITIPDQERVAQLVVCPVVLAEIEDATDLSQTDRAEGGFGSTGVY